MAWSVPSILAGIAAIVTAAAGVYLAVRTARRKERQVLEEDIEALSSELADERRKRLACERLTHRLRLRLAQHGLDDEASS